MKRAPGLDYESLRLEGGLLSPTLLDKVRHMTLPHQQPGDYGIEKGLTIRDELARYWRIARARWEAFEQGRHRQDIDLRRFTLDEWLLPLLETVLGYQVQANTQPLVKGERRFPITHRACDGVVPLVLTAPDQELDKGDARFGEESRRRSPQGLAQEYLNAEQDALWALVSNGRVLRLLRDNPAMTRPAYLEIDFQRLFEEDNFADFSLVWLLLHHSRLMPRGGRPKGAILEQWREQGQQEGERALGKLRVGVTQALRELGSGFLDPDNAALRQALAAGELAPEGYFQELLRLVYRFLFLLTAEDRDLVLSPEADEATCELYRQGYSLGHLRERARYRSYHDRHEDAWEQLRITFEGFRTGQPLLGQPALGGLFAADQCPHLDAARLGNRFLYKALFHLAWFQSDDSLVRINYRDMGTEELGSVYESLLELVPVVQVEYRPWRFIFLGDSEPGSEPAQEKQRGSARKTTGSYYTPDSLVQELIHSTLEPVIERTLEQHREQPVEALLSLKIVDPAAGSGHFLLAAARRLAAVVARLRASADQSTETDYRHALREVVAHCIYGVDINPLAVELCKTALWLETVEPGKPLGFLAAHIRCGNALVGVLDPAILTEGIPDDAYKKPLTGDNKQAATQLKKANKAAREGGVMAMDFGQGVAEPGFCAVALDHMPEDTPEQVEEKRRIWKAARQSDACRHQREAADLFVAAFFASKRPETIDAVPTSGDLIAWREGRAVRQQVAEQARELARRHRFFHWYIEFPEVFERGGFDCVLGNPPWDQLQFDPREFFSTRNSTIAKAQHMAERKRRIEVLEADNPRLYSLFVQENDKVLRQQAFVHGSGRFPYTSFGRINLAPLFAELSTQLPSSIGRAGIIVPSGIATDSFTQHFFRSLFDNNRLVALYDFENREAIFPSVHRSYKFALLTLGSDCPEADFLFFATHAEHLRDPRRRFQLSAADIHLLNPNTHTCPVFRSRRDAELTKKIYRQVPVLIDESRGAAGNPWGIEFMLMFMMNTASHLFHTRTQLLEAGATEQGPNWVLPDGTVYVPLYEAKMVHQFDHRWAEYEADGKTTHNLNDKDHADPHRTAHPRYWVPREEVEARLAARDWNRGWLLGWRDICRSTDERTVIAGVVPRVGVGNNFPLMFPDEQIEPKLSAALVGNLSALAFDFVARHKVGGTHLNFFIIKQLPVLPPNAYTPDDLDFIVPRVLELTYTAEELRPWAEDLMASGEWQVANGELNGGSSPLANRHSPFPWNGPRRRQLRAELDAWYARLYGLTRDELRYLLDPADIEGEDYPSETFRVLKKKEMETFGEYLTRRLVLEAWDRLCV